MKHHSICFMPRHPWSILIWSKSHKPSVAVSPVMQWAAVAGHGRTDSYSFCLQRILAKTKQRRVPIARCSNDWPTHGNTGAWIHSPGSRSYSTQPALPFSNCTIKESQYGWIPVEEKTDATNSDTVHGGNVRFLSLTLNDQFFYSMPNRATLNTFLNFTQTVMKGVARFQTSTASLQFELPAVSRVAGKNIALLPKNPLPPACCHGTARRLRQKS